MAVVFHGGRLDAAIAKYGGNREDWLDLSTGINPNSYPVSEISSEAWNRLPDRKAEEKLLCAAQGYYEVPAGFEVVAAPGTQAIIQLLPRLLQAKTVEIISPTYWEHAEVWNRADSDVLSTTEIDDLSGKADAVVVVNPNNPDCRIHDPETLARLSDKTRLLVVDEAFADTMPDKSIVTCLPENVVVLKSFGKFFGLAGLRLGFAICEPNLADRLRSALGPWAVSGAALEIGSAALADQQWINKTRGELEESSQKLASVVTAKGLDVRGRNPLFLDVYHSKATSLLEYLSRSHILVRPFPDRAGYLRFGICKDANELRRLESALEAYGDI
ncbi:MAG: threonine-phosphate decarboxylase CobD [Pseudomonadota bacterium]